MRKRIIVAALSLIFVVTVGLVLNRTTIANLLPGPENQDRGDIHYRLGSNLRETVHPEDIKVELVKVDGENINLAEYQYSKTYDISRAKERGLEPPDDKTILRELIDRKIKVAAAHKMDLYPTEAEINAYVEEQRKLMHSDANDDINGLLKGWGITEEEYLNLMRGTWADSIAIERWYTKTIIPQVNVPQDREHWNEFRDKAQNVYDEAIFNLRANTFIEITPEGKAMGITLPD